MVKRMLSCILLATIIAVGSIQSAAAATQDMTDKVLREAERLFDHNRERPKAYAMLMDAYRQADSSHDKTACAYILQKYASFLWIDGNPSNGLAIFQCALSYCPDDETALKVLIVQGIGQTYSDLGQYTLAEKHLKQSLELAEKADYTYGKMMAFHNLGLLYFNNKDYAKSIDANNRGLALAQELDDKYMESSFLINLGQSQTDTNEKIKNLIHSIRLAESMGDSLGAKSLIPYAWYTIAKSQLSAVQYDAAIQSAQKVLSYSDYVDEGDYILESTYSLLADIYAAQKDFNSAYHYNELYRKFRNKSDSHLKNRKGVFVNDFREIERRTNDYLHYSGRGDINWQTVLLVAIVFFTAMAVVLWGIRSRLYRRYRVYRDEAKEKGTEYDVLKTEFQSYKEATSQRLEDADKLISDLSEQNRLLTVFKDSRNILLTKISAMIKDISESFPIAEQVKFKNLRSFINNSVMDTPDKKTGDHTPSSIPDKGTKDFKTLIKERFPNLSANEVQLCEYFQIGLNTREISQLSGKPMKTVNMARYRLRKSLGLSPEEDLHKFLLSLFQ